MTMQSSPHQPPSTTQPEEEDTAAHGGGPPPSSRPGNDANALLLEVMPALMAVATTIAVRYRYSDVRELHQQAMILAWKAIPSFDPGRGKFLTYIYPLVKKSLKRVCARARRAWARTADVEKANKIGEDVSDHQAEIRRVKDAWPSLQGAMALLPHRSQVVIELHYLEDKSFAEIGRSLNISERNVRYVHLTALKALRGALTACGFVVGGA